MKGPLSVAPRSATDCILLYPIVSTTYVPLYEPYRTIVQSSPQGNSYNIHMEKAGYSV